MVVGYTVITSLSKSVDYDVIEFNILLQSLSMNEILKFVYIHISQILGFVNILRAHMHANVWYKTKSEKKQLYRLQLCGRREGGIVFTFEHPTAVAVYTDFVYVCVCVSEHVIVVLLTRLLAVVTTDRTKCYLLLYPICHNKLL